MKSQLNSQDFEITNNKRTTPHYEVSEMAKDVIELNSQELFRLASLIGTEPENEERHRADLERFVQKAKINTLYELKVDYMNHTLSVKAGEWIPIADFIDREIAAIDTIERNIKSKFGGSDE